MNATLHLPSPTRRLSKRSNDLINVFAALLITLRGLLGPDEEAADDPAVIYYIQHKYAGAGD